MILVCAATGTEAAACRQGIADAGARGIEVLTTGVGQRRAADALARWVAHARVKSPNTSPALVVSSGFAGALTADIEPLCWVTATGVYRLVEDRAVQVALSPGLIRVAQGATACRVVSFDQVVAGSVRNISGPAAADMESAALAEVAGEFGLPFLVLRLVTDTPTRPMATVGRSLAAVLAARGIANRAAHGLRAALDAARSPARTAAFLRETALWRKRLRAGWREQASRGVPSSPLA